MRDAGCEGARARGCRSMSRKRAATARATVNASANANARRLEEAPTTTPTDQYPSRRRRRRRRRKPRSGAAMCAMRCSAMPLLSEPWKIPMADRQDQRPSVRWNGMFRLLDGWQATSDGPTLVTLVERDPGNRCLLGPVAGQPSLCCPRQMARNGCAGGRLAGSGCPAIAPLPRIRDSMAECGVLMLTAHSTHTAHSTG